MSRCRFIYDEQTRKKVLIPGCYGSLHRDDLSCCTCNGLHSFKQYERKEFNDEVRQLRQERDALLKENNQLHRIIQKLSKRHEVNAQTTTDR